MTPEPRKIVAIVQARMSSTRLPGKVLLDLDGQTVLKRGLMRARMARRLSEVMVATTVSPADDPIERECRRHGFRCFRGSEEDVLSRYCLAAEAAGATDVVRITSDCPLFDPALLDAMIERYLSAAEGAPIDYLSNTLKRTYPRGLDAEIFRFAGLKRAFEEARKPFEREHVTPYFYQHPELFRLVSYEGAEDNSRFRWTLDTPEDWELIKELHHLVKFRPDFTTAELLGLMREHPELAEMNAHVEQKKL